MKGSMLAWALLLLPHVAMASAVLDQGTCEALTLKATTSDVINYVLANPYSIGYQGYDSRIHSEVLNKRLVVPDLDGADGKKVSVSVRTIQEAMVAPQPKKVFQNQSLGECSDVGICASILDPNIPNAWPITTLTYIFFPTNVIGDNLRCQQVRALYDYLMWVVASDAAAAVAHANHFGVIPAELRGYVTSRLSSMKCNGVSVLNITVTGEYQITLRGSGSSLAKGVYDAMNAAYNSKEEIYKMNIQVDYAGGGSGVGLQDMLNCRVDYAGSDATSYNDQNILNFLTPCSNSVVMFANLADANITSFFVTKNLISSLFAGEIFCWNDTRLQEANPGIKLPMKPVLRAVRTGTSGTTETFTHAMATFSGGCNYNVFRCSNDPLWPPPKYDPNLYDGPCPCRSRPPVDTSWSTGKIVMVTGSTFGAAIIIFIFLGWTYIGIKRKQSDSLWEVRRDELKFADPIEVLGRGTFGIVLKAEYRGTFVAVKRVIPPRKGRKRDSIFASGDAAFAFRSMDPYSSAGSSLIRPDNGTQSGFFRPISSSSFGPLSRVSSLNGAEGGGVKQGSDALVGVTVQECPAGPLTPTGMSSFNSSGDLSSGASPPSSGSGGSRAPKWSCSVDKLLVGDRHSQMKKEFIEEMRLLSKLRHPCITTIMGAVVDRHGEPMLVMECMEYGSLYDLLHNDTAVIEGELILPILCDVAQGIRFLHAARPMIVHGDLKAQNVLVDSSFRAKVADFGFTQKKRFGRQKKTTFGTPLWMAPELLKGAPSTPASDVYAFGILLSEVYSRRDPYEGEDVAKVLEEVANVAREEEKRPYIPPAVPKDAASLMKDCWNKHADARPHFDEIERRLRALDAEEQFDVHGQIQGSLGSDRSIRSSRSKMRRSRSNSVSRLLSVDSNEEWESRSNALLYDLFPKHIAEALQEGRKVEPEHKDLVTIFFSDIVGFTTMSCDLAPGKISDMLDRLYSVFDRLSHELGIYKLETIGDAYMAITNLVEEQEQQHALLIARFAIEALNAACSTLIDTDAPEKGCVQIRVGIHSGPIVANVVGTRRPKYTLFGDTVNTASRMESNSLPNRIHCSLRTAKLIEVQAANSDFLWAKDLALIPRGDIEVKGKGMMKTFWVDGRALGHGQLVEEGPSEEHKLDRKPSITEEIFISSPPTPLKQVAQEPDASEQSDLVLGALHFWSERDREVQSTESEANGHVRGDEEGKGYGDEDEDEGSRWIHGQLGKAEDANDKV